MEDDKKDMLFKIVTEDEIDRLQVDIQKKLRARNTDNRNSLPTNL